MGGGQASLFGLVWYGLVGDIEICFKAGKNHTSSERQTFRFTYDKSGPHGLERLINQDPKD